MTAPPLPKPPNRKKVQLILAGVLALFLLGAAGIGGSILTRQKQTVQAQQARDSAVATASAAVSQAMDAKEVAAYVVSVCRSGHASAAIAPLCPYAQQIVTQAGPLMAPGSVMVTVPRPPQFLTTTATATVAGRPSVFTVQLPPKTVGLLPVVVTGRTVVLTVPPPPPVTVAGPPVTLRETIVVTAAPVTVTADPVTVVVTETVVATVTADPVTVTATETTVLTETAPPATATETLTIPTTLTETTTIPTTATTTETATVTDTLNTVTVTATVPTTLTETATTTATTTETLTSTVTPPPP